MSCHREALCIKNMHNINANFQYELNHAYILGIDEMLETLE